MSPTLKSTGGVTLGPNLGVFPLEQTRHVGVAKSEHPRLTNDEIIFEEFQPMWSQFTNVTDRQTDGQTTCDRNTALCTKVHCAVIKCIAVLLTLSELIFYVNIDVSSLLCALIDWQLCIGGWWRDRLLVLVCLDVSSIQPLSYQFPHCLPGLACSWCLVWAVRVSMAVFTGGGGCGW